MKIIPAKFVPLVQGAVNQAVKAIAIARGYTAPRGLDLKCIPGFASIESHDGTISAIVFTITSD